MPEPAVTSANDDPASMSAGAMAAAIVARALSAADVTRACLRRIGEREPTVLAWAFLDEDQALARALAADDARVAGARLGPLHGVPVGVKDIFDTSDMPTENGTRLHAGRRPVADATVVARLRGAGAVILGKTVTTELAVYHPGKTTNPRDPKRTPGGSSSGSAAAVAAGMIPVAVGSQTNGSVIRPAAYCGVIGYKPTFGLISRHGVLAQSRRLDHVGVMSRTLDDAALIAEVLIGFDGRDPDVPPRACPRLRAALAAAAGRPRLALARTPYWERADPDARERIQRFAEQLGAETLVLPPAFEQAAEIHRVILEADLAHSFAREYEGSTDALSVMLRSMIERGQQIRATEYQQALRAAAALQETLDAALAPFDAALTPATVGEAPLGLESTGSPLFCTIWTLCGTPALTLPALTGASGMPLGVQLVAPRHADARLFRAAQQVLAVRVSSS